MEEKREEKRGNVSGEGAFYQDGYVYRVKIRDKNSSGVGVYTDFEFKPGLQGLLLARFEFAENVDELPMEVCWCMPDPMTEDLSLPFRAGLRCLCEQ